MGKKKIVGVTKAVLWFITTFWFAYLSVNVLWSIDRSSWMILLRFNEYGEAFIEIPIFFISAVWIMIAGSKEVNDHIKKHKIINGLISRLSFFRSPSNK